MNRYISILHHVFFAKKRHGLHSPFVYGLSDVCFRQKFNDEHKRIIETQRKKLNSDTQVISISDFGAGSKKMGSEREARQIFKNSRSSDLYSAVLYQLAKYFKPDRILELGTSLAWGTLHLHLGNASSEIDTIEGCPETHAIAESSFPIQTKNVHFHQMQFEKYFEALKNKKYDLVFIDGNHKGEALKKYIALLSPFTHHDTLWLLDDIRWSDDMWQAWQVLSKSSDFHVSIDLGKMGVLVKRPEQRKEHFMLRL